MQIIKSTIDDKEYIYFKSEYKDKDILKDLGCKWDSYNKKWFIVNPDDDTMAKINNIATVDDTGFWFCTRFWIDAKKGNYVHDVIVSNNFNKLADKKGFNNHIYYMLAMGFDFEIHLTNKDMYNFITKN
jgi:hypothetical protein